MLPENIAVAALAAEIRQAGPTDVLRWEGDGSTIHRFKPRSYSLPSAEVMMTVRVRTPHAKGPSSIYMKVKGAVEKLARDGEVFIVKIPYEDAYVIQYHYHERVRRA